MEWSSENKKPVIDLPNGKKIFLASDGHYYDKEGTQYGDIYTNPEYCGLEGIGETGKGDPWHSLCAIHDKNFTKALEGYQDTTKDNLETFKEFSAGIATGMLFGGYQLLTGPLYWLVGGVGGLLLQTIRNARK